MRTRTLRIITVFLCLVAGCHSADKKSPVLNAAGDVALNKPTPSPEPAVMPLPGQEQGESRHGRFSRDGREIIFQSSHRPDQKNSQIYILHLKSQKERRITYNDGEDSWPSFSPDGKKIIYASTTDELKEHPPSAASGSASSALPAGLLEEWGGELPDDEIYESDADGSHIQRLTNSVGFDGEPDFSPDGHHVLFTSIRKGKPDLFIMGDRGAGQNKWAPIPGIGSQGVFSPDGKEIAWITVNSTGDETQIFVADRDGGHQKPLTGDTSLHLNPSWSPDGKKIFFSGNMGHPSQMKIYLMDLEKSCIATLTSGPGNDVDPQLSPDGRKLLFASDRSGSYKLYLVDFSEPATCLKASSQASRSKF